MCLFPSFTIWAHVGLISTRHRDTQLDICLVSRLYHQSFWRRGSASREVISSTPLCYGSLRHKRHVAVNFTISLRMTTWHNAKLNVSHRYHNVSNVSYLDINVLDRNRT